MNYYTYFDLIKDGAIEWWWLMIPFGLAALGILMSNYRKSHPNSDQKYLLQKNFIIRVILQRIPSSKAFLYFYVGLTLSIGVISSVSVYATNYYVRERFLSGQANVVEGVISEYDAGTNMRGSAYDTFCIDTTCFTVSDSEIAVGFHNQQINGSPLRKGLQVRLSYVDDTIVKLEIATSSNPLP